MDVRGYDVDVRGYCVDVRGYGVDDRGYGVDVRGYGVNDVRKYEHECASGNKMRSVWTEEAGPKCLRVVGFLGL